MNRDVSCLLMMQYYFVATVSDMTGYSMLHHHVRPQDMQPCIKSNLLLLLQILEIESITDSSPSSVRVVICVCTIVLVLVVIVVVSHEVREQDQGKGAVIDGIKGT